MKSSPFGKDKAEWQFSGLSLFRHYGPDKIITDMYRIYYNLPEL